MRTPLGVCLLVLSAACAPAGEEISFSLPRDNFPAWLSAPWPSDVFRQPDEQGVPRLSLRSFPNPGEVTLLEDYLALFQELTAYAKSQTIYFQVPAGIDQGSLPQTPGDSVGPGATMFMVELSDPSVRVPIEWQVFAGDGGFFVDDTVAVTPLLGAVPQGSVALVVTTAARGSSGTALAASDDLTQLMNGTHPEARVKVDAARYRNLLAALALRPEDVALIQFVDTVDRAPPLLAAARALRDAPPPRTEVLYRDEEVNFDEYNVYVGEVDLEQYLRGAPPYDSFDGTTGRVEIDDDGRFVPQFVETVEFVLTVPKGAAPDGGWPIAVMGHGTGGWARSGLGNAPYSESHQLARAGWATIMTSEPVHRTREGWREGQEELLTFNFLNPPAGGNIWRQSVLEKVQLVSAVQNLAVSIWLDGGPAFFDTSRIGYFGHSQGGIVGAMLAAVEPRLTGVYLSGAGGGFAPSLAEKTEPVNLPAIIRTLLGLPEEASLDRFHPVFSLFQIWVDPADPINYGDMWRTGASGHAPHLVATSGLLDDFTPKRNHAGMAAAYGLSLVEPVSERFAVVDLVHVPPAGDRAQANRTIHGAPTTAAMMQYPNEGHFAVFRDANAQESLRLFFETLTDGAPVAVTRPLP